MKILINKTNLDALKKVAIEREIQYQVHEVVGETDMVAVYLTYGVNEISTTTAFFLGAAWMLEQDREELLPEYKSKDNPPKNEVTESIPETEEGLISRNDYAEKYFKE